MGSCQIVFLDNIAFAMGFDVGTCICIWYCVFLKCGNLQLASNVACLV